MNRAISGKWKIETIYIYTNIIAHMEKNYYGFWIDAKLKESMLCAVC